MQSYTLLSFWLARTDNSAYMYLWFIALSQFTNQMDKTNIFCSFTIGANLTIGLQCKLTRWRTGKFQENKVIIKKVCLNIKDKANFLTYLYSTWNIIQVMKYQYALSILQSLTSFLAKNQFLWKWNIVQCFIALTAIWDTVS